MEISSSRPDKNPLYSLERREAASDPPETGAEPLSRSGRRMVAFGGLAYKQIALGETLLRLARQVLAAGWLGVRRIGKSACGGCRVCATRRTDVEEEKVSVEIGRRFPNRA